MKIVQDALAATGIPTYPLAWRVTDQYPVPPETYLVYTTRLYESQHSDDVPQRYTLYVYLNMWTKTDPESDKLKVRAAMRNADFGMDAESTTHDESTEQILVAWTWVLDMPTEVSSDGN